jgi:hypothetical protein
MATYHDVPVAAREELACYCCGEPFNASDLVRFDRHPHDGVCIGCAAWLHRRSMPIVHKIHPPFWWRFTPKRFHRS